MITFEEAWDVLSAAIEWNYEDVNLYNEMSHRSSDYESYDLSSYELEHSIYWNDDLIVKTIHIKTKDGTHVVFSSDEIAKEIMDNINRRDVQEALGRIMVPLKLKHMKGDNA